MQLLRSRRRALTVLLSLVVLVAMTAMAPAATARDRSAPLLTAEQVDAFKDGAREVAGLSDAQIAVALRDPVALQGVPVSVKVTSNMDRKAGIAPDAGLTATYGKTAWVKVSYYNIFNIRLASFKLNKYWEYNYSRDTSAPAPWVNASVTGTGAATGWEYKGIIGQTDYYYSWNGVWHGGHKSYRQGKFTTCIIKIGCWQSKQPWISIYAHYNGSWSYSYAK